MMKKQREQQASAIQLIPGLDKWRQAQSTRIDRAWNVVASLFQIRARHLPRGVIGNIDLIAVRPAELLSPDTPSARICDSFHLDRSPVCQDFGNSVHDVVRVVAHADDRVRSCLCSVCNHPFERFFARLLTQARKGSNISTNHGVERTGKSSQNGPRPYGYTAHNT